MNEERKAFLVTDLGGGDGGKGGMVHKICCEKNAHTVVKVGGAQGSHGVRTSRDQSFNFGQFGCGTFEGVRTHISNLMVAKPFRFMKEGLSLKNEWGLSNVFDTVTVDKNALCITPFHMNASRLRELARGKNPKGTIGTGAGEAVRDAEENRELAVYIRDLGTPGLRDKLENIRKKKLKQLEPIIEKIKSFPVEDRKLAQKELNLLIDPDFSAWIVTEFNKMKFAAKIVDSDYLAEEILSRDGTVVFESSHGILTDRYYGFHPHVSHLRTIPQRTFDLLGTWEYTGKIVHLGVTRAYQIRHGAGPMVTESQEFLEQLLPGSNKDENRWQGKVRVGSLDFVTLRYAINVCGGPEVFDGLAISWFDQVVKNGVWRVCESYTNADDPTFFENGNIKVRRGEDAAQIAHQNALGEKLRTCKPNLTGARFLKQGMSLEGLTEICKETLLHQLKVPVRLISFGPTEDDKVCI